ncbi:hypothetical protein AYO22_09057 [Fonsecaea multimorphosa]|nr:hypothetical protein AYO22_09057 [Fonsecaea multimorphosa]
MPQVDVRVSSVIPANSLMQNWPLLCIAAQHGVPAYESVENLLDAHKSGSLAVDAIILATPTQTHMALCQLFAGSGLALLIEKPLSTTGSDGKQMLSASKKDRSNVYMVGHHRRHNAYVRAVKDILEKEKLGRVVAVNGVWAMRKHDGYYDIPWHTQPGFGGVILTNAIHEIDMLQYWLGPIEEVFAMEGPKPRPIKVDQTTHTTFKFSSGVLASFLFTDASASHQSWEAATGDNPVFSATGEDFLTIFGTKGSISMPSMIRYHYDGMPESERNWKFPLQQDGSAKKVIDNVPAFENQLKHFIAVARREAEPNCSVEDALRAVLVTEAVFRSLETGNSCSVEQLSGL